MNLAEIFHALNNIHTLVYFLQKANIIQETYITLGMLYDIITIRFCIWA